MEQLEQLAYQITHKKLLVMLSTHSFRTLELAFGSQMSVEL